MASRVVNEEADVKWRGPMCRVCLSGINCTHDIFVARCSDGVTLASALVACARIQISVDDGLPSVICDKCANDVETFVRLRRRCTESNVALRRQLQRRALDDGPDATATPADAVLVKSEVDDVDETRAEDRADGNGRLGCCAASWRAADDDAEQDRKLITAIDLKVYRAIIDGAAVAAAAAATTRPARRPRPHAGGEKPFACELCRKSFTNKSNLLRHVRSHSGERPFECDVCFKSFALKHHLYEHVRIHSGDRPFKCRVCDKAFSRNSHLLRHSRTHHADRTGRRVQAEGEAAPDRQPAS